MKKLLILPIFIMAALSVINSVNKAGRATDNYIRERTVMLMDADGICSGIQIQAPSGKVYILTANHCASENENELMVINEHGKRLGLVKILVRNVIQDLMLTESIDKKYIKVAKSVHTHDHVRSFGHAYMLPSKKSEGEILMMGGIVNDICMDPPREMIITTLTLGAGDSGGPVVNDSGELVAVNHAVDMHEMETFSCVSRLYNIQKFLANK